MGRTSTIDETAVFAAVGQALSSAGSVTLQSVVAATGVSIGSLYHRYESREGLLAATWLDAVSAFQVAFNTAWEHPVERAGEEAALTTPRFCRAERARAIVLSCCRQSEFLSSSTPEALRQQIATVNDDGANALRRFARSSGLGIELCRHAIVGVPLGIVRAYLPSRPVPARADDYVRKAYRALTEVV
ncbi:MAG: TetR family transcriptional regulator [Gammaproteobacteria bacterium]